MIRFMKGKWKINSFCQEDALGGDFVNADTLPLRERRSGTRLAAHKRTARQVPASFHGLLITRSPSRAAFQTKAGNVSHFPHEAYQIMAVSSFSAENSWHKGKRSGLLFTRFCISTPSPQRVRNVFLTPAYTAAAPPAPGPPRPRRTAASRSADPGCPRPCTGGSGEDGSGTRSARPPPRCSVPG